jgi:hypothetical protein
MHRVTAFRTDRKMCFCGFFSTEGLLSLAIFRDLQTHTQIKSKSQHKKTHVSKKGPLEGMQEMWFREKRKNSLFMLEDKLQHFIEKLSSLNYQLNSCPLPPTKVILDCHKSSFSILKFSLSFPFFLATRPPILIAVNFEL